MANVVSDTNLFYYLGSGKISLDKIKEAGDTLYFSPLTIIEIVSKVDEESYERRRAACRAILESGAVLLPDPQSFLTERIFEHRLATDPIDWPQIVKITAESPNLEGLRRGYPDYREMKIKTVGINYLREWREAIDTQWKEDLLDLLRDNLENYDEVAAAVKAGTKNVLPKLKGEKRNRFLAFITSPEWYVEQMHALYQRSLHYAAKPYREDLAGISAKAVLPMIDRLGCYMSVYSQYVRRLLVDGSLPKENDSGDIEHFLYLTDDSWVLATAEKLWPRLATEGGYEQRARQIKL